LGLESRSAIRSDVELPFRRGLTDVTVSDFDRIFATRLRFGRYVFATGGNPEAAELAGVNTKRLTVMVFTLMGALVGISLERDAAHLLRD